MITKFPEFTKLKRTHAAEVQAILVRFDPYADFSFGNLLAWGQNGSAEIALLHGNIIARLPDYYTGTKPMVTILGDQRIDDSLQQLLGHTQELQLVPAIVVRNITNSNAFKVAEDRDNTDYMYDARSLATFEGGDLKKKRNKVHSFVRDVGDATQVQIMTQLGVRHRNELRHVFKQWSATVGKSPVESKMELAAFERLLAHHRDLNLRFTVIRVGGRVAAFSIHELYPDGHAICHFEKALPVHPNVYEYVIQQAAKDLYAFGIHTVNWQQDLGLPGLRQAKISYRPSGFLQKYTISAV